MNDKKTIREWEQAFELNIVDMDGFDKRDPRLFERLFTREEFENAIADCTVIRKHNTRESDRTRPDREYIKQDRERQVKKKHARHEKKYNSPLKKNGIKSYIKRILLLYVAFPLPAAAVFLLHRLYRLLKSRIRIRWYYPLCVGLSGALILLFEPITTLIAGPLYVWYLVLSVIASILGTLYNQLVSSLFHKAVLPPAHDPFLSSVNLFGNPMNLYFSPGKAITSSIVIAILLVCATDLRRRMASTKSAR